MRRGGTVKETGPKRDTNSNGDALKIGDCFAVSTTCWFGDRCELTREAGEKRVFQKWKGHRDWQQRHSRHRHGHGPEGDNATD